MEKFIIQRDMARITKNDIYKIVSESTAKILNEIGETEGGQEKLAKLAARKSVNGDVGYFDVADYAKQKRKGDLKKQDLYAKTFNKEKEQLMCKEDVEKELLKRRLKKGKKINEGKSHYMINEDELRLTLEMAIKKTLNEGDFDPYVSETDGGSQTINDYLSDDVANYVVDKVLSEINHGGIVTVSDMLRSKDYIISELEDAIKEVTQGLEGDDLGYKSGRNNNLEYAAEELFDYLCEKAKTKIGG